MQSKSVDEFVQAKVLPQFHPVVAMLRELMAECAPQAEMEDKHGLLRGVGKVSRHVKLKSPDSVEEVALRDYIRQALELEAR
jgi:hypothetical protein